MQSWNTYIHDNKKTSEEVFYYAYAWRATVEAIGTILLDTPKNKVGRKARIIL